MPRYIYGLDPASKNDFFGIVIHNLPNYEREDEKPIPKIKTLRKLRNMSYDEILELLTRDLFKRYPPYYIVIDYTNEKTFSDLLISQYGKDRVEKMLFNNTTKGRLKDDGIAILKQKYKFKNPNKVKDPQLREWLEELIQQLKNEQILVTSSGKTTFDHPQGEHNDLAVAWELSVHGCLKFMIRGKSHPVAYSANPKVHRGYAIDDDLDLVPELRKPGITITDITIHYPS